MTDVIAKRTKPLCFLPSGRLVAYRDGELLIYKEGAVEAEYPVFGSKKERWLGRSKWLARLLRLGVRQAIAIDDDHVVLSVKNVLFEYCFSQKRLSKGFVSEGRIRPLYFTEIKGVEGFDDCLVWGEYLINMDKHPVRILRRTGEDQWEVAHTFEQGAINHIHNIVADPYRKCLWVFTGDFDEAAAIWKVTDNFRKVERVVCNDQNYRACVAFALPEGLLYATDTPFIDNYIYLIRDTTTMKTERLAPLSGSCIYGCRWRDKFVFSSTVEGGSNGDETFIDLYFRHPLGAGIKDDIARLYVGNMEEGFHEVTKGKKDFLSYLFQLAVFMFPSGTNNSDSLYFYPMATTRHDLSLMRYRE